MQKKLCEILYYAVRYVSEFALQALKEQNKFIQITKWFIQ